MVRVLLPLADGFEEIEATTAVSLLRESGVEVTVATLLGKICEGARGIKIIADKRLDEVNYLKFNLLVLVENRKGYFLRSQKISALIHEFNLRGKYLAAIGSSVLLFKTQGLLEDRKATTKEELLGELSHPRGTPVVIDGHIITSQSPGTAIDFTIALIDRLQGKALAESIRKKISSRVLPKRKWMENKF